MIRIFLAGLVAVGATLAVPAPATPSPAGSIPPAIELTVIAGTERTGRYMPREYSYRFEVPELSGATEDVEAAFRKKVRGVIAQELAKYNEGAITKSDVRALAKGFRQDFDSFVKTSCVNFTEFQSSFRGAVYRDRYASVVLTFTGINAVCSQLSDWAEYVSTRSITIDTQTGRFMSLSDFTSNEKRQVSKVLDGWKGNIQWGQPRKAVIGKRLAVCNYAGNANTMAPVVGGCNSGNLHKEIPVSWRVTDKGLTLGYQGYASVKHVTIPWGKIPQLL
jgi:hypothetical protein